jgi:putative chitinase
LTVIITADQVAAILKTNVRARTWHPLLIDMLPRYSIDSVPRIAGFMAQCAHESRDFTALEENLNYSEAALLRVFPRYFGPGKRNAAQYARNPQKLANYVYMDEFRTPSSRLGNTQPGDGWRFRGGGIKQLTGRTNFTRFGQSINMTAEEAADYVRTQRGALESACWFWRTNNLNSFADARDIVGMSRRINGGDIGLQDRTARWNEAIRVLSTGTPQTKPAQNNSATQLRRGSNDQEVIRLQRALGIAADGTFGPATEAALIKWQITNKLTPSGVLDDTTRKILFN